MTSINQIVAKAKDQQTQKEFVVNIGVIDEYATMKVSDIGIAKRIYLGEKKQGNKDISIRERTGILIQKYPGKSKEEIAQYIQALMQKAGWKQVKVK